MKLDFEHVWDLGIDRTNMHGYAYIFLRFNFQ